MRCASFDRTIDIHIGASRAMRLILHCAIDGRQRIGCVARRRFFLERNASRFFSKENFESF
jgi:hypothetical protein